jgi:hypothetical protein
VSKRTPGGRRGQAAGSPVAGPYRLRGLDYWSMPGGEPIVNVTHVTWTFPQISVHWVGIQVLPVTAPTR